jgi:hypothetical protein
MKTKKEVLDVDFIGGQDATLTQEEEAALHDFFAKKKSIATADHKKSKTKAKRTKSLA